MVLSPDVAKSSTPRFPAAKPAAKGSAQRKSPNSPWAGTNMTEAYITRAPNARSQAEIRRATSKMPKFKTEKDEKDRKDRGFHALKMQRTLAEMSYGHRTAVKKRIADVDDFEELELLPEIKTAMKEDLFGRLETVMPSAIQKLAIPALLGKQTALQKRRGVVGGMEQFLLAAETGSGKTLAYLLPILDAIKRAESVDTKITEAERKTIDARLASDPTYVEPPPLNNRYNPDQARPKVIILVPTSELVTQVTAVAKRISHQVKFRTAGISAAFSPTVIRNRLFSDRGIDVVVSTPHLLASICQSEPNLLSRVSHLVIDEADSLLDRSFAPTTTQILDRASSSLSQLILCSATIPRSLDNFVRERFPNIVRLTTPNLHAVPRRVQLSTIDVDKELYRGNRDLACADTIWSIGKEGASGNTLPDVPEADANSYVLKRILVFVNERETSADVAEYLRSKGIDAEALTRDTPEQRQAELLAAFTMQPTTKPEVRKREEGEGGVAEEPKVTFRRADPLPADKEMRKLANTKVLVTTDLGSRGIDTLAVRHVILYDVPHSTIDFIHRLGRVGRMNRRGRGIVLVGKKDRRDVVAEVKNAMFKGQALI